MQTPARIPAIDMLRGFVIALMALDHTRDFFGIALFNAEDLAATTPAWFWTRWITHLCATVFVLLAGSSAFLRAQGSGVPALSRYLATRGAMLLLLEATWISFSWQFGYNIMIFQVIWALGAGMMMLSLLVWLPRPAIALIAALLIVPHNALDAIESKNILWMAWHQGGFYQLPPGFGLRGLAFMYPLMPWVGLIAAGYALGPVFLWERARRARFLLATAGVLLLAFVVLRAFNLYGDPDPWKLQGRGLMFDLMSFMRVHKYPPSLLYLCVTSGLGLLLLVLFERIRTNKVLLLFGGSPLFFYVVHIALIHFLGNAYYTLRFGSIPEFTQNGPVWPDGYVASLPVVYAAWVAILALMYGLVLLWRRARRPAQASTALQSAG
ncbi:MAG: heparan-alpha-glucosaminide N-acetyltransferase domain-containing protein [Pseudomonadota bacterium]